MAKCGWCLTRRHDECLVEICSCGCPVKTGFWYNPETKRYAWRCPVCKTGWGRDAAHDQFLVFFQHSCRGESRMETPIKSGAQKCWDYIDATVDEIATAGGDVQAAAQNRARGAAACMAIIYGLKPETISAEAGRRLAARQAGQERPYYTDAELRGMYEPAGRP